MSRLALLGARLEVAGVELDDLVELAIDARLGGVVLSLSEWEAMDVRDRHAWTRAGERLEAMQALRIAKAAAGPLGQAEVVGQVDDELGREKVAEVELAAGLDAIADRYASCDEVV